MQPKRQKENQSSVVQENTRRGGFHEEAEESGLSCLIRWKQVTESHILTGVFLEYLFVLALAVDGKALEDFMQRTDLTRSLFQKDNNMGCVNVEFSLEDEICSFFLLPANLPF